MTRTKRRLLLESLEKRELLTGATYHYDTNGDDLVNTLDIVACIKEIDENGIGPVEEANNPLVDINQDRVISTLDVLVGATELGRRHHNPIEVEARIWGELYEDNNGIPGEPLPLTPNIGLGIKVA